MRTFVLTFLLAGLAVFGTADSVADERLATIRLPDGFVIEPFADVPNARQMAWGEQGTLFVGTRRDGRVFAVTDADGDGRGERVREIASGLQMPSGVAFHDGALYVGAVSTILRFDDIESRLDNPPAPVVVTDRLPSDQHHGWKVLGFGPDGLLYAPVGAPCNVCRVDGYYGSVLRMRPDGSEIEVYARGVRNSVGLAWHPVTGELWFTDNGRDHLGDDLPPCELNRAREAGLHYGFPFCHADTLRDPNLGGDGECTDAEPPAQALGPHVAPLGLAIHSGTNLPDSYRGAVFIAEHGSWNRTRKIGYRITVVRLADDHRTALGYETFADGWLKNERAWGRPADVLEAPDGSLMVSDDRAGKVYRIRYVGGVTEAANRS
ncbi:MAG: PQQ-dependent sugar dehydrogenase [Rhodospirillales bacterium]|nr:PQQ-dependent sugar dehydrogenase [Rhodospirillales bacterium]